MSALRQIGPYRIYDRAGRWLVTRDDQVIYTAASKWDAIKAAKWLHCRQKSAGRKGDKTPGTVKT
jgi:hypothetical protein